MSNTLHYLTEEQWAHLREKGFRGSMPEDKNHKIVYILEGKGKELYCIEWGENFCDLDPAVTLSEFAIQVI